MAGIANDVLVGFSMPAQNAAVFDHTYVAAQPTGSAWGCFGRSQGGARVTAGAGSSATAECLSYRRVPSSPPDGNYSVYAGLIYGLTGVCHQAANRILFPAQIQLPPAVNGYAMTRFTFGPRGLGPWKEFLGCHASGSGSSAVSGNRTLTFAFDIVERNTPHMSSFADGSATSILPEAYEATRTLLREHLHRPLPEALVLEIVRVRLAMRDRLATLANDLLDNKIDREDYLRRFADVTGAHMREVENALGEQDFNAVFGEAGHNPAGIIDHEVFLAH